MTDQACQSSIDEFQCAKYGAVYDVAITRLAARADYDAICNVCQKVMNEWHGTVGRAYTLKSQAAKATPPLIHIDAAWCAGQGGGRRWVVVGRSFTMNPRKTPALAEFPQNRDVAAD